LVADHRQSAVWRVGQGVTRADDFMTPPSSNAWCVVPACEADLFVRLRARSAMAGLWLTDDLPAIRARDNRTPFAGLLQAQLLRLESRSYRRASASDYCPRR